MFSNVSDLNVFILHERLNAHDIISIFGDGNRPVHNVTGIIFALCMLTIINGFVCINFAIELCRKVLSASGVILRKSTWCFWPNNFRLLVLDSGRGSWV